MPGSVGWHGTQVRAVSLRKVLMAVPGRTIRCAGDPLENAQKIAAVFQADGYKAASPSGEFPIRLTSGSHALEMLGFSSEFLFPLLAIPGVRKRVVPTEVRIRCLGEDARETTLRVETRARGGAAREFTPKRFEELLGDALTELRTRGRLLSVGDLTDSAREEH